MLGGGLAELNKRPAGCDLYDGPGSDRNADWVSAVGPARASCRCLQLEIGVEWSAIEPAEHPTATATAATDQPPLAYQSMAGSPALSSRISAVLARECA